MIDNKFSIKSILKSPRSSLSPFQKKVSFNHESPSRFNFGVVKSQMLRANVYERYMSQQAVFQKLKEIDEAKDIDLRENERLIERQASIVENNSLRASGRSGSRVFKKKDENDGENSPNVSLELSNSSRLSISQIQEIIMKKEQSSTPENIEITNLQNAKGKFKALQAINIFQKKTASPEKKKIYERLTLDHSAIHRSMPENENKSANISFVDARQIDTRQTKSDLMERLSNNSKILSPARLDETRSRIINVDGHNDDLNQSRDNAIPENLKTEQEMERSTKSPKLLDFKNSFNPNVNLDYVMSATKSRPIEMSSHKLQAGKVMTTVIQNLFVNKTIEHYKDAFEAVKRDYLTKTNRRKRIKGGCELLDMDKFFKRKMQYGFFKLYDNMHESLRMDYALDYHHTSNLNRAFKNLKNYAVRKISNQNLIKTSTYRSELKIKKKIIELLKQHTKLAKETMAHFRAEFLKLKSFKIFAFWQKYARRQKIKKMIKKTRMEEDLHTKHSVFSQWKSMISEEVTNKLKLSKDFYSAKMNQLFIDNLKKYYEENIIKKQKKAASLLFRKNKMQGKYFAALKFETFERGKRQIVFDKDVEYLQLKISVKDKVSKTIYKSNNFAVISNEKSITIDVPKRGIF